MAAHALEIGAGYIKRLTNPDAYSTFEPWCCGLPMIQPGNKALIDDYWIDASIWPVSYPVAGESAAMKRYAACLRGTPPADRPPLTGVDTPI